MKTKLQRRIPYKKQKKRTLFLKKRADIINLSYLGEIIPKDILAKIERKRKYERINKPKNALKKSTAKPATFEEVLYRYCMKQPAKKTQTISQKDAVLGKNLQQKPENHRLNRRVQNTLTITKVKNK